MIKIICINIFVVFIIFSSAKGNYLDSKEGKEGLAKLLKTVPKKEQFAHKTFMYIFHEVRKKFKQKKVVVSKFDITRYRGDKSISSIVQENQAWFSFATDERRVVYPKYESFNKDGELRSISFDEYLLDKNNYNYHTTQVIYKKGQKKETKWGKSVFITDEDGHFKLYPPSTPYLGSLYKLLEYENPKSSLLEGDFFEPYLYSYIYWGKDYVDEKGEGKSFSYKKLDGDKHEFVLKNLYMKCKLVVQGKKGEGGLVSFEKRVEKFKTVEKIEVLKNKVIDGIAWPSHFRFGGYDPRRETGSKKLSAEVKVYDIKVYDRDSEEIKDVFFPTLPENTAVYDKRTGLMYQTGYYPAGVFEEVIEYVREKDLKKSKSRGKEKEKKDLKPKKKSA